ncbi:MAG: glycosyltransferase family 4 protein [Desulfobulbaceae bacterium]|nr:glycosyltransferase family 4 protein [Desulfobulbaceae bacterium]
MKSDKFSIALIVPSLFEVGGVPSIAAFLHQVLSSTGRYEIGVISLATSIRDADSIRLLAPSTWARGIRVSQREWQGYPYQHVGAIFSELDVQRYRPRRILTDILNQYDLIQVVAGTPSWALVTQDVRKPICLFVATTVKMERESRIRQITGWRRLWFQAMTRMIARMEPHAIRQVDCVFAESEYTRRLLSKVVPSRRLVLSVPGIDTCFFRPDTYCHNGPILSVGRWGDPRKNIRLLFDSYCRLLKNVPNAPNLVLAGATLPLESDYSYAHSLGIAERVRVLQNVSQEELRALYQGASLFVLPSNEEGLGIVLLEAMACGLPVVSTRCGGPETAVVEGETGYLTPVGDAEVLALRMSDLIQDPTLRQCMGTAGRRRVEERFSLAAAGKVYLDKYNELLNQ